MKVVVNGRPVSLAPGMTVRHALLAAGLLEEVARGGIVTDCFGNQVGLGGEPAEGEEFFVTMPEGRKNRRKAEE